MGERLTEYALRLAIEVVESAANTFTQVAIDTPVGQLTTGGKVQAMEIMKIVYDLSTPSLEDAMDNFITGQLTRSSVSGLIDSDDPNLFWQQVKERAGETGVDQIDVQKLILQDDFTDGNGTGQLFYGGTIFGSIAGSGNASAKFLDGHLLYHLVELNAIDVVMALLTA